MNFSMKSSAVIRYFKRVDEIQMVMSAVRMCDANGRFKDENGYFGSTYLTPSGLPIEGYQYLIANSHIRTAISG